MSDPSGSPDPAPSDEHTISVDLVAFLPDGVELVGSEATAHAPWRPDLEALDGVEADLAAVDDALQALDDGTYGTCRSCNQPIADDLLAANPARTTCDAHPPT